MIDTSKLVDALSKVVDLAHREETARAEIASFNEAIKGYQADIDAIAEQLIEASGSKVEAAGILAVANALTSPIVAEDNAVAANIAKMDDMLAGLK